MKIERTNLITFNAAEHSYTTNGGRILTPVSSVLNTLEAPFDSEGKSLGVAKREILAKYGLLEMPVNDQDKFYIMDLEIKDRAQELRDQWEATGQQSLDFGNWIDKAVDDDVNGREVPTELKEVIAVIREDHKHYYQEFTQFMVFDEEYGVCGTMDRMSLRGSRSTVIDITDVKTGINKGMTYDGYKIKDGIGKYYNKFYLEPLSHIEASSYARYTLQISMYAFLLQRMFPDVKIGRLKICFVHREEIMPGIYGYRRENIPVMYMRNEVQALLERVKTTKEMLGTGESMPEKQIQSGLNGTGDIPDY